MRIFRKALSALVCIGLTLPSVPEASAQALSQAAQAVPGSALPVGAGLAGLSLQPMGLSGSLAGPSSMPLSAPAALRSLSPLPSPSVSVGRTASQPASAARLVAQPQASAAVLLEQAAPSVRPAGPSAVANTFQAAALPGAKAAPAAGQANEGRAQARDSMASAASILKDPSEGAAARQETGQDSWNRFWSGSSKARADESAAVDAAAPVHSGALKGGLRPSADSREEFSPSRLAVPAVAAGAGLAGTAVGKAIELPAWLSGALEVGLPYAEGAGVLAITWGATRLASWALDRLWKGRDWDRNVLIVTRMSANVVFWLAGATIALKVAGMDWSTLLTGLGVGSLAVSMSVRKVIGNFIYGAMLLADRPFRLGERVRIGDVDYTVKDMTFRYIVLEGAPGTHSLMDYSQLAGKPLRLHRKLDGRKEKASAAREDGRTAEPGGKGWLKWAIMGAAASALGGGGWLVHTGMAALKPYVLGGAALGVSWLLARLSDRILRGLAAKHGWDPTLRSLLQMAVSGVVYIGGLLAALSLMGVSWSALLAGAGVLSVGVTIAATDMVSNLLEAGWILLSQPFRVGDRIRVGDQEGTVVDMTLRYVVLNVEQDGRTETILLPYSLVSGSTLTVFKDYVRAR